MKSTSNFAVVRRGIQNITVSTSHLSWPLDAGHAPMVQPSRRVSPGTVGTTGQARDGTKLRSCVRPPEGGTAALHCMWKVRRIRGYNAPSQMPHIMRGFAHSYGTSLADSLRFTSGSCTQACTVCTSYRNLLDIKLRSLLKKGHIDQGQNSLNVIRATAGGINIMFHYLRKGTTISTRTVQA